VFTRGWEECHRRYLAHRSNAAACETAAEGCGAYGARLLNQICGMAPSRSLDHSADHRHRRDVPDVAGVFMNGAIAGESPDMRLRSGMAVASGLKCAARPETWALA